VDQTVLANEQVDENGRSWRSGAVVERKLLKQWFIKTSQYATALRDGLNTVSNWFDVVDLQRNWIGEITGNRVTFEVWNEEKTKKLDIFSVFLENLTGLLGAAFVSIPPDHELRAKYKIDQKGRMNILCRNPFTGDFFPVFGLDAGQESEARLGVPSLSEADKVFADSNSLPFKKIFDSQNLLISEDSEFSGLSVEAANRKIAEKGEKYVSPPTSAKLKDWLISRQRYWGTPIPLILCSNCGPVPVPLEQLPVKLPLLDKISTKGGSLLAQQTDWLKTDCPKFVPFFRFFSCIKQNKKLNHFFNYFFYLKE
jgi:leucyl-tRNA synthetase